ncbi:MAG: GGDEF domain-containing protein [Candidatus Omnitrophica bacterium]|nr:GGDEF domain-containing protein [Candidatus Omnitrophota bacterium]
MNVAVVLAMTCFCIRGVLVFGLAAFVTILWHSLHLSGSFILPLALLSIITLACYFNCLHTERLTQKAKVELGNLEEENNILTVELHHACLENNNLKQKLQRYITLKDLTDTLSSTLSLEKATSLISSETFNVIGKSEACLLYLVDQDRQRLYLASTKRQEDRLEIKAKEGDVFDNWVFKQRTRLMVKDIKKDFRFSAQEVKKEEARGVQSLISAPLVVGNKVLGILRLDSKHPELYDTDDLRILDIMSDLAAVAIQTTMFYQKTQKLAITDGLTGTFVHRHFQERFEQEISRTLWTNSQFAFLMIDIDNFKSYNDKYGHIAGDIVLKQIAGLIKSGVNPGDIVARYGGEEFGVLLVDTPQYEAIKIAERIKEKIEKEKFVLRREATKVTISAGIAFFPKDARKREDLIRRADMALYKAKAEGKNRICIS